MGEVFGSNNVFSLAKYDEIRENVWGIKIMDMVNMDEPKSKIEMEGVLGTMLTRREYDKLKME
jgi:hypothetical protein